MDQQIMKHPEYAHGYHDGYHQGLSDGLTGAVDLVQKSLQPTVVVTAPADMVDYLHLAICQAVHLMNQGDLYGGHDLLRQTLIDFADKKAPLSRSEIVRQQQRSGGDEVTAVMASPLTTPQKGEKVK